MHVYKKALMVFSCQHYTNVSCCDIQKYYIVFILCYVHNDAEHHFVINTDGYILQKYRSHIHITP